MREDFNLTRWILFGLLVLIALLAFSLWNYSRDGEKKPESSEEIENYLAQRQDSLEAEALQEEEDPQAQVDTSSQSILFIGDSMAQGLSIPLNQYADFNGHRITTLAKQSATIISWVGRDSSGRLKQTIEELKPSYVIICLGSNELMTRGLEAYKKYLKNIHLQAGESRLIWVGPPNWREDNGLTDLMAEEFGLTQYFPSKALQLPRAGDGIHPTYQGYFTWADSLSHWIQHESDFKIRLEKPRSPEEKETSEDSLSVSGSENTK